MASSIYSQSNKSYAESVNGSHLTGIPDSQVPGLVAALELSMYSTTEINANLVFRLYTEKSTVDPDLTVTYVLVNCRSRYVNHPWSQMRGVIVRDYRDVVARTTGLTSQIITNQVDVLNPEGDWSFEGEDLEGRVCRFNSSQGQLRPALQGFMIRLWKQNNIVHISSASGFSAASSKWLGLSYAEMFRRVNGGDMQCFGPEPDSPYCHLFLVCHPSVQRSSYVDCGEGYFIYYTSVQCYTPRFSQLATQERESYFLLGTDRLTSEDLNRGLTANYQVYCQPTMLETPADNWLTDFLPYPVTVTATPESPSEYTPEEFNSTTWGYEITPTMSGDQANAYLRQGSVNYSDELIDSLIDRAPLYLPGETLIFTTDPQLGPCVSYLLTSQSAYIRSVLSNLRSVPEREVMLLRDVAVRYSKPNHMQRVTNDRNRPDHHADETLNLKFEDLASALHVQQARGGSFYWGLSEGTSELENPEAHVIMTPLTVPEHHSQFRRYSDAEVRKSVTARWAVLALARWLMLPFRHRVPEFAHFGYLLRDLQDLEQWIVSNRQALKQNTLVLEPPELRTQHIKALGRLREIVNQEQRISEALRIESAASLYRLLRLHRAVLANLPEDSQ